MASIRNLKKDINYVLGDIIDAVYFTGKMQTEEGKALVTENSGKQRCSPQTSEKRL